MWSYYGSKSKIVDKYPKPTKGLIIEPFAGTAKYALKYWDNDVILIEKNKIVYRIWKWLQECSVNDIQKLPRLKQGDDLRLMNFDCEEAKWLMGFMASRAIARPNNIAVKRTTTDRPNWINFCINRISKDIAKIKHWDIRNCDYTNIENKQATWFIDPPYQFGGQHYPNGNKEIDFKELAKWCKERKGEVIVCENIKANWMNFEPLTISNQTRGKGIEVVFLKGWKKNNCI